MKHLGLFEGIGGFSLAARWMGWDTVAWCEINPFCQKVLKHHFPEAEPLTDIKTTDFTKYANTIDVLTGGFPCQPYSTAGKRLGKEDDRHLWPEMLRAIREIKPVWVVGENVRGLTNWNGGLVFDEVQADLENEGFEVLPFLLPACAVNAPHRRERIWFVAYSKSNGDRRRLYEVEGPNGSVWKPEKHGKNESEFRDTSAEPNASNSNSIKLQGRCYEKGSEKTERHTCASHPRNKWTAWENFPTQPPVRGGDDGLPASSHGIAISENRNNMDRNLVTKLCLDEGRLRADLISGKIYSLKQRGKEGQEIELKGADCNGYIVHGIRYNGFKIQLRAHQIVWIAANGLYDKESLMIDHINRNKKDNRIENLRLVDAKGNRENSTPYKGKLTDEQKDMIVWLHKEDGIPIRELADDYGISKSRVHQIIQEHSGIYGITFSKWRNESIKAYGNAIVPQVAYNIFKAIEQYTLLNP